MSAFEKTASRILVTGASGQLGFELVRALQSCGQVIAADRTMIDLSDFDQLRQVIREIRPALIVNPAAYTAVDKAESEPEVAMRINGEAPGLIAEEAKRLGAILIHYSTDYVFDGEKRDAYVETDPAGPLNVYGRTKLAGEHAIEQVGGRYCVFRTSWVYGTRGKNFFLTMRALAARHRELRVVADQTGAPTWSATLADLTTDVVKQALAKWGDNAAWWSEHSGVYHMTARGETTWAGFAEAIFELAEARLKPEVIPIASDQYPTPAARPHNSRLSNERLEHVFGVRAPHWRDALQACYWRLDVERDSIRS
ncbi:dTDP-4-dehydrorhamnose reductase [Burkholderia stagnalis]|uniref:dTDP-4-dehydrorhamnose reductase n=1 Tax=Burkholderia stagnalis TaxID=1503054 RepID=A0ABX9YSF5_9BURK|nr:dTDP-4-dehydrorhamnose reductase [Burkholderia stagnalis]KWI26560.1 dTDP-4-dehydrorhamnose reductase [Burkholderia stagnalis]KWI75846.1 dTDP-4-dehydrorhamnose reductase [Burkholderia stagnalis]RQQ61843.1 dTDP-4-dehydrorhamnose reductase [Burkholderia stagnalis]RQQ71759.1 dTDP-4-dehydrorhamnose reductase [Burkholderia stagnalis]RQQ72953.1 dTDP-4-dehydrorhamnose reductase [Burkholderia stagnalis]